MTQSDFNSASLYGYCINAYCIDDSTARALLGFESRTSRLSAFLANLLAAWLTCINAVQTPVNRDLHNVVCDCVYFASTHAVHVSALQHCIPTSLLQCGAGSARQKRQSMMEALEGGGGVHSRDSKPCCSLEAFLAGATISSAQVAYLADVLCMHVGQGRHAGGVRTRLVVLLLCQGGVDCGKLALQPLHLQSACHILKTHRRLKLCNELDPSR